MLTMSCNISNIFSGLVITYMLCIISDAAETPVGAIFYNQELFDELGRRTELGFDGTFHVVPDPFYQLWTGKYLICIFGMFYVATYVIFVIIYFHKRVS